MSNGIPKRLCSSDFIMENHDQYQELPGLSVNLDNVVYMPSLDAPADKPYPFVYFISVINASEDIVRITGRKWIVREQGGDVAGELTVVEGEGVVGENPVIPPMEHFSYNSYHVVASRSFVKGSLFGVTSKGVKIRVKIPDFTLEAPEWA